MSVLIFTKAFFGSWVQIDGRAEIVDQPEALDLLVTVYRTIAGEHPDWDEYREAMIRDERVVIRIHPERIISWGLDAPAGARPEPDQGA